MDSKLQFNQQSIVSVSLGSGSVMKYYIDHFNKIDISAIEKGFKEFVPKSLSKIDLNVEDQLFHPMPVNVAITVEQHKSYLEPNKCKLTLEGTEKIISGFNACKFIKVINELELLDNMRFDPSVTIVYLFNSHEECLKVLKACILAGLDIDFVVEKVDKVTLETKGYIYLKDLEPAPEKVASEPVQPDLPLWREMAGVPI